MSTVPANLKLFRIPPPIRLTALGRVTAAGIGLGCLISLLAAARISPSHGGTGTHEQLGLPPCGFLSRTGIPCGTCGMTTSFSLFVRGDLWQAVYVQPFGAAAALGCAMTVWVAGYVAVTGRPLYRLFRRCSPTWIAGLLLAFWLLSWGWKIWTVVSGHDGW